MSPPERPRYGKGVFTSFFSEQTANEAGSNPKLNLPGITIGRSRSHFLHTALQAASGSFSMGVQRRSVDVY
jgi:hypothetical protein